MIRKIKILLILLFFISVFSFAQTIRVTSPNSRDTWYKGKTYTITWTKTGSMNTKVKIRLMQKGKKVLGITDSTPNDGSYSWTVPTNLASGTYYIRVKTVDNGVYDDGEKFAIISVSSKKANIFITSPRSGDTWYKGRTYTIRWTKTGNINKNVKIRLYKGRTKILGITDSTPNVGSYNWTIPTNLTSGVYYIRVKTVDNAVYGNGSEFTIKSVNASAGSGISITNPSGPVIWGLYTTHMIQWTYRGSGDILIQLYKSGKPVGTIYNGANTGTYKWKISFYLNRKFIDTGNYKLRVRSKNNSSVYAEVNLTISSIIITSPEVADEWHKGSTYTIAWTKIGKMNSQVKILLKEYDKPTAPRVIAKQTANNGFFIWKVPMDIRTSSMYTITVETIDKNVYASSKVFYIQGNRNFGESRMVIISPHKNEVWKKDKTYQIKWLKKGKMDDKVKIGLYKGNTRVLSIANSTVNNGVYEWKIPPTIPEGIYTIRVKTIDNYSNGNSDVFTIKNPPNWHKIEPNIRTLQKPYNPVIKSNKNVIMIAPDLVITNVVILKKQRDPLYKGIFDIEVEIKNIGNADIPKDSYFLLEAHDEEGIYFSYNLDIGDGLKKGEKIKKILTLEATNYRNEKNDSDKLTLIVAVDKLNEIKEINENNNEYKFSVKKKDIRE